MAVHKNFALNAPGDPPPWGGIELQAFKDIIDTIVSDTLGTKDVTGHKHTKVYNGYSQVILDANNTSGTVTLGGDSSHSAGQSFLFSVRDTSEASYLIEGNSTPAEHAELLKITYGIPDAHNFITLGGGGTQRVDIKIRDLYSEAFRLRVGEQDAINVSTSLGEKITSVGAPGATYPIRYTSNSDMYTRAWQEITHSCLFIGFLDLDPTNNHVWIKQVGGLVFVQLSVVGNSDSNFTRIQFPFSMQGSCKMGSFYGYDSSGIFNVVGTYTDASNTLYTENYTGLDSFWQNDGAKGLSGSFIVSVINPQF